MVFQTLLFNLYKLLMKKITLFISLLLAISFQSFASEKKVDDEKKICIREWGWAFMTDYCQAPVFTYTYTASYGQKDTATYQGMGIGIASFHWGFRFNLRKFSDDNALSLSLNPGFALGPWLDRGIKDGVGVGMINMPLLISYDMGAGATYGSIKDRGGFIAGGVEFYKTPIIFVTNHFLLNNHDPNLKKRSLWMEPVLNVGYRYWHKSVFTQKEKLRVVGLKFGMGGKRPFREIDSYGTSTEIERNSWSIRLYFSTFLGF